MAEKERALANNRKAFHNYDILAKYEAGIKLYGPEVKSVKAGRVSIGESYAQVENGQVYLCDMHILPYEYANGFAAIDARRPRLLLLHAAEIGRLFAQVSVKGRTLIPLKLYLRKGWIKVELGVGVGRHTYDKREVLMKRITDREARRDMVRH